MNPTPMGPDSHELRELARLLPEPVERELPGDRHRQIQEFVMSHIQQDPQPRRAPRRRLAYLTSALAAGIAAVVAAVVVGTGGLDSAPKPEAPGVDALHPGVSALSGPEILLVAADAAERSPDRSGTYWYLKVVSDNGNGKPFEWETWTAHDGRRWFRGEKSGGKMLLLGVPARWQVGDVEVSLAQLRNLPTEPAALKAWIAEAVADAVERGDLRNSGGRLDARQQEQKVFEGLISLVCQLPAPQKVRAAAFRAIADYPNVTSLGPVEGGYGLQITFTEQPPARLVINPETAQVRRANFYVTDSGGLHSSPDGEFALTSEWTDTLPR